MARSWNPVEEQLLRAFYHDWPAAYIALGLARSIHSVRRKAHRLGVKGIKGWPRICDELERAFWPRWRSYILHHLHTDWLRWLHYAYTLTFFPPQYRDVTDCRQCPGRANCSRDLDRLDRALTSTRYYLQSTLHKLESW